MTQAPLEHFMSLSVITYAIELRIAFVIITMCRVFWKIEQKQCDCSNPLCFVNINNWFSFMLL